MSDYAVSSTFSAIDKFSQVLGRMGEATEKFGSASMRDFGKAETASRKMGEGIGDNVRRGTERAEGALGKFREVFKRTFEYFTAYKFIDAIYEKLRQLPEVLTKFAEQGDYVSKTARQIGLTAEAFQQLQFAAERQGITNEDFTKSMQQMNKFVGQARAMQGSLYTYLVRTNPALLRQLMAVKDSEAAFNLLTDAISKAPNKLEGAALANAAFGRSGQGFIIMAQGGVKAINDLRQEAVKYGDIISNKAAAASENFVDSMTNLKASANALKVNALGPLIEKFQPLIQRVADWVAANRELISQKIESTIDKIGAGVKIGIDLFKKWSPLIIGVAAAFTIVTVAQKAALAASIAFRAGSAIMEAYALVTGGAATVQEAFNLVMAANPIGLVITAIAALIAVGILIAKHWKEITAWIDHAWKSIKAFAVGIWNTVLPYLKAFGGTLMKYWLLPINLVMDGVEGLLTLLSKLPGKVGAPFKEALQSVTGFQDKMNQTLTGSAGTFDFGGIWKQTQAPNRNPGVNVTVPVNVDNSAAPGVSSSVRQAPPIVGPQGNQWGGGN